MSENCGCGSQMNAVDKVRRKGVANQPLAKAFEIVCSCGHTFMMTTHEDRCPSCGMVFGVTPCSADSMENVVSVGIDY